MIRAGDTLQAAGAGTAATIGAFATDHVGNLLALTTRAFVASDENFVTSDHPMALAGRRPSGYYAGIAGRPEAAENLIGWVIVLKTRTVGGALPARAIAIAPELLLEDVWMLDAAGARCDGYVSGLDSSARFTLGDSPEPQVYRGLIRVAATTPRERFAARGSAGAVLHNARGELLGIYVGEAGGQGLFAPLASTLAAEGLELASSDALAAHNRRAGETLPDDWGQELPPAIERIARTLPAHEAARSPTIILSKWVTLGIAQQQAGIEEAFSPYDDYFDNNPADRDGLVMRLSEFCYFELPHGPEAADWDRVVMDAYAATVQRPSDMAPERDLRGSHARVLDRAA